MMIFCPEVADITRLYHPFKFSRRPNFQNYILAVNSGSHLVMLCQFKKAGMRLNLIRYAVCFLFRFFSSLNRSILLSYRP